MRNIKLLFLLACACALTACSDDSQNGNAAPVDPPGPSDPIDPPAETKATAGESCASSECEDGLSCEDNVCVAYVGASKACDKGHICNTGLICTDGVCVNKVSGEGMSCEDDTSCSEGLKCNEGICKKTAPIGELCDNAICIDSECIDNICTIYVGENEDCSREQGHLCQDGLICHEIFQTCYKVLQIGTECDPLDDRCEAGLTCNEEHSKCMSNGALGDDCDFEANLACDPSDALVCKDGKCRKPVEDVCDELHPCAGKSSLCYEGKCIKSNECSDDSQCLSDTYCCTEEACKVKGICLPYGEGPRAKVNEECHYETVPGLFEADIQCEWKGPAAPEPQFQGDAQLADGTIHQSDNVLMTPLVMNTPHDSGTANEIIFTSYNNGDGGAPSSVGSDFQHFGVIRIINAETCELLESIFDDNNHIIASTTLAIADVDGDGHVEIFAGRGVKQKSGPGGGIVAFHWDGKKYVTQWQTTDHSSDSDRTTSWAGPSIQDINDDEIPEILGYGGEVFNALNGQRINPGQTIDDISRFATVADLDGDGAIEIIGRTNIYRWNKANNKWVTAYTNVHEALMPSGAEWAHGYHYGYADFGSFKKDENGADTDVFEFGKFDGKAEIVNCGGNRVMIASLNGKEIFKNDSNYGGGPCTIGDFDGDGIPEVATAFGDYYTIFDPQCTEANDTCMGPGVMWKQASQDLSSRSTGSSLFDFDGDGAMEAVYADECFTRVYDGKTGDVLFSSYRSSDTWHEYPVIADVDNDESAELIVGSNNAEPCPKNVTPRPDVYFDPIHRGLRCANDKDCKSGKCVDKFCRCDPAATTEQCNYRLDTAGKVLDEYGCTAPLAGDEAGGSVCRAKRRNGERVTGVRVMRDRLDRWTSSRNIWNQHVYNITNINDDQTIPQTSNWIQNFLAKEPTLNNLRQNVQGVRGKNAAPDITCKLDKDNLCVKSSESSGLTLKGMICNRGTKMVASKMPASFYEINADGTQGKKYCTAYTATNVPIGDCLEVSCALEDTDIVGKTIRMIANDDGNGGKTTVECIEDNNTDEVLLEACDVN
ncbi:MAG: VCBS repeat-containing protein [Proteobacteria bacterium]|nr:VCBS repeat-containing protein [Pseudomonadota bacterium]